MINCKVLHNLPEGWIAHNIDDWVEQCSQPVDGVGGNVRLFAEDHLGNPSIGKRKKLWTCFVTPLLRWVGGWISRGWVGGSRGEYIS